MSDNVIETSALTMYYGRHRGIVDVNLVVHQGEVFGFLGPNGAGKTTTQRILLDVIRPTQGQARIFGLDCQKEGVAIRQRTGYLPGELSLYPTMTGKQFLDLMNSLHGKNDDRAYRKALCERLNLDTSRRMREYSRGNKQKIGVVAAFMNKPDLIILDEPTNGLDPLVQQTVLALVREARADGRTVFFSSHILPEVQAVCDRVGIIREGQLVATERVESLTKQQFKRLRLYFDQMPPENAFDAEGVEETARDEAMVLLEVRDNLNEVLATAVSYLARWQIVTVKAVAMVIATLLIALLAALGAVGVFLAIEGQIETTMTAIDLFWAVMSGWPLALALMMISFFLGAYLPSRRIASVVATLVFIISYFGNSVANLTDQLEPLRPLFIFSYLNTSPQIFTEGVNGGDVAMLLGVSVVFFILAFLSFQRRNITVGAWPWQRPQLSG